MIKIKKEVLILQKKKLFNQKKEQVFKIYLEDIIEI